MFCVVTGDIGTGKTTLLRYLLKRRGPHVSVGMITGMNGTYPELLQWTLSAFGLEYRGLDKIGMQQLLVEFVKREEARGRRMVLIIDEAQALATEVLEDLRLFSNVSTGNSPLLQMVLVGQLALRTHVAPSLTCVSSLSAWASTICSRRSTSRRPTSTSATDWVSPAQGKKIYSPRTRATRSSERVAAFRASSIC